MNEQYKVIEKMGNYHSSFISSDIDFDEQSLSTLLLEACEFAYTNFQEKDEDFDGYNFKFEVEISTIGLRLSVGLKNIYPNLKKSPLVLYTIFQIINTEKYANGRDSFMLALWENKLDKEFIFAIQEHHEFWSHSRIVFDMVWGLTKRRIGGFSKPVNHALETFTDKKIHSEIIKQCKKYLENEHKYKHYSCF